MNDYSNMVCALINLDRQEWEQMHSEKAAKVRVAYLRRSNPGMNNWKIILQDGTVKRGRYNATPRGKACKNGGGRIDWIIESKQKARK